MSRGILALTRSISPRSRWRSFDSVWNWRRIQTSGRKGWRPKPILPIDATTADVFGELAAIAAQSSARRRRSMDLWLASQAIQHGFRLVTRNDQDFQGIPGLDLVLIELPI